MFLIMGCMNGFLLQDYDGIDNSSREKKDL